MHRSLRLHLLYCNSTHDQSEGLFRGLSLTHKYVALSKVGPLLFKSVQNSWPCLKLNLPRRCFAAPAAPCACNATCPVRVHRSLRSHLLYWNTTRDQSKGLFRGLTSNPKYTALSKVGPPLWVACGSRCPVRVHRSLRSHLLYWNTTRDQSEGLF